MTNHNPKGSSFDDFLADEGILAEAQAEAIKRTVSWYLQNYINENNISKKDFAETLGTSRSSLDRLLDPKNKSVTLNSMVSAVAATGKKLEVKIAA